MELFLIFTTAVVVGFSGALMPGPVTAVMVEHTLKRGFIAAPLVTLGHAVLEVLMVVLLAAGLSSVLAGPVPAGVIGVSGGAVLIWMGYGMLKSARSGALSLHDIPRGRERKVGPIAAGIAATIANPYWFLWWATVGAGYITLAKNYGPAGVFLFLSGHLLADLSWHALLAGGLVLGKNFISDKIYRGIIIVLGLFLMGLAVYFLFSGVKFLMGN